tara:strand:+ start:108 stop:485 length:378 start_codon:yes stop_codon:yes gene_type:complete
MKCPCCGYDPSNMNHNPSKAVLEMISKYGDDTKKIIKKVMRAIYDNVSSDKDINRYYQFLYGIKKIDGVHIKHSAKTFLDKNYHLQGKGFSYLLSMIRNRSENHEQQLKNERKSYGKSPKKRIID